MRALSALGNEAVLCTYHLGKEMPGIEAHRIPRIPWYTKTSAGPSVHKFYLDLLLLATCGRAFRKRKPDLIHAFLHEGGFIGEMYRCLQDIPLVVDLQGSLTDELRAHNFFSGSAALYRFFNFLEKVSIQHAEALLASSAMVVNILRDMEMVDPARVHLIPDGVDTDQFKPRADKPELRERLGLPHDRRIVVYIGLLNRYQGTEILLKSAARLRSSESDPYFLIVGFPDVERYEAQARDLGIADRVRFTGRVDYREEAPLYLAAGDVAASPKISRSEANLKLLEYMATGLPTVVFDTPVNRDLLGEDGVYAECGSEESFAHELGRLLENGGEAGQRGRRLRKRAEEMFSWNSVGEKILSVYRQVLALILLTVHSEWAEYLSDFLEVASELECL
jgi:glycosyltransferase involved in cell wall biosynthesis